LTTNTSIFLLSCRHEEADPKGNVKGYYSYIDDEGTVRKVEYTAGPGKGFVVHNKHKMQGHGRTSAMKKQLLRRKLVKIPVKKEEPIRPPPQSTAPQKNEKPRDPPETMRRPPPPEVHSEPPPSPARVLKKLGTPAAKDQKRVIFKQPPPPQERIYHRRNRVEDVIHEIDGESFLDLDRQFNTYRGYPWVNFVNGGQSSHEGNSKRPILVVKVRRPKNCKFAVKQKSC